MVIYKKFQFLTKTLIDSTELHEKLAENINRVIPNVNSSANGGVNPPAAGGECSRVCVVEEVKTGVAGSSSQQYPIASHAELDHAIKRIVEDTSADPVFENLLQFMTSTAPNGETSDDYEERRISNTSTPLKAMLVFIFNNNISFIVINNKSCMILRVKNSEIFCVTVKKILFLFIVKNALRKT